MEKEKSATQSTSIGQVTQKLGNTTYTVNLYTSTTSKETMGDKLLRLARNNHLKSTATAI